MKFVEWCDLFLIGHQTIDKQHQVLFDIANRFHSEVYKGFSRRLTTETLNQLIDYAQTHFATEEEITGKLGFSEDFLENHKYVHEQLIIDIFNLNEDIVSGKIKTMYEIEKFLTRWLVLHILTEDKKYRDYLIN